MTLPKKIIFTADWQLHDYSWPSTSERLKRCIYAFNCLLDRLDGNKWWVLGDFFQTAKPCYELMIRLFGALTRERPYEGEFIEGNHDQTVFTFASPLKMLEYSNTMYCITTGDMERAYLSTRAEGKNKDSIIAPLPFCRKAEQFLSLLQKLLCIYRKESSPIVIACHQYFEGVAPFEGAEVIQQKALETVIDECKFKNQIYFVSGHYHLRTFKEFDRYTVIYPGCALENTFGEVDFPVGGVELIQYGSKEPYFEFFDFDDAYEKAQVARFKTVNVEEFLSNTYNKKLKDYFRVEIPTDTPLAKVEEYKKQLQTMRQQEHMHIIEKFTGSTHYKPLRKGETIAYRTSPEQIIEIVVEELSVPAEYDQKVLIEKGKELIR